MTFFEETTKHSSGARAGSLRFGEIEVKTPTFMPVGTKASVKGLTMDQVRSTGAGIVLGNTYHLHLTPGEDIVEKQGGLKEFSRWQGPMLTDSGGFQVFSLANINKITDEGVWFTNPANGDEIFLSPEKSIQIQHKLGADIIMAFDDVVSLSEQGRERTKEAFDRTHDWLERSIAEHKRLKTESGSDFPKLFGIAQGGLDKDLRLESLKFVQSQDVDGVAIGGLSVGESREEMHDMLEFLAPHYDDSRPRYLMGVGHPIDMRFAIEHGIDMFDCVLPTRNGRHGTAWLEGDEQVSIKAARFKDSTEVIPGDSVVSEGGYTLGYLNHLIKSNELLGGTLLSIHNLRYLQAICEEYQS